MTDRKGKILKGGVYLTAVKAFQQFISFSVNAVLAIILSPEIFGIVALVTVFNGFISVFTNFGFGSSIIQSRKVDNLQLSSLFWLDLSTSVITFGIIFLIAPFASEIYKQPEVSPLLRLISINFLLVSFFSLNRKLLEKELEFSYLANIDLLASIISSIAGITLALLGFKAYSLIWQYIILNIAYLYLIRRKNNWFADFYFKWNSVKDLVFFAFKFKGALTINFFERNIDFLIIGKLFTPYIVGLYSFAYNIMYMPVKRISNAFSDVLFPSFSSVNDDLIKLKSYFLRAINTTAIITFPITVLIYFNIDFLVNMIFGPKWSGAIYLIKVLCFAGALLSLDFSLSLLPSINKTELSIYSGIFRIVLTVAAVLIGSLFGIYGVAYGILIVKILSTVLNFFIIKYFINIRFQNIWSSVFGPLLSAIIISSVCLTLNLTSNNSNSISVFFIILEVIISIFVVLIVNKQEVLYFYNNIVKARRYNT